MNSEQLTSLLRTVLQVGGAFVVGRGWVDDATMATVGGALLTLIVTGWGLYTRRNAGLVASAATVPAVKTIVTDSATASAVPSVKVQPSI